MTWTTTCRLRAIDSHTGGEPTRVIIDGGPDLGTGPLTERLERFRDAYDHYRSAIVNEPRGSAVVVGALLLEPFDPSCEVAVIFFNNVGYLGMCGHGTIGLVATLSHLGRIAAGHYRVETPVGVVSARLHENGRVSVDNVPSHRQRKNVVLEVPLFGPVAGDIAWGGNWFFLTETSPCEIRLANVPRLTDFAWQVRQALAAAGYAHVDHVELFGPSHAPEAHSRNFVLCPGRVYDRSPCGTGTSAKLACLAADGKWAEGEPWIQESVIGSRFETRYRLHREGVIATITGAAFMSAETTLLIDSRDHFGWGIRL